MEGREHNLLLYTEIKDHIWRTQRLQIQEVIRILAEQHCYIWEGNIALFILRHLVHEQNARTTVKTDTNTAIQKRRQRS